MGRNAEILPRKNSMLCRRMKVSSMDWPHRCNWWGTRGIMADKQCVVHNRHDTGGAGEGQIEPVGSVDEEKRWTI